VTAASAGAEDDYNFPTFSRRCAKAAKTFDILDNDNGVIHGAIYSLGTASHELIAAPSSEVSGRDGDALWPNGLPERSRASTEPCCGISRMRNS